MWYVVVSKVVAPREQLQPYASQHAAWLKEHHQSGDLILTGPVTDGSAGIWVLRANSKDDAQKLLDAHPWHANGLRKYEMYEWAVHQFMGMGPFSPEALQALQKEYSAAS